MLVESTAVAVVAVVAVVELVVAAELAAEPVVLEIVVAIADELFDGSNVSWVAAVDGVVAVVAVVVGAWLEKSLAPRMEQTALGCRGCVHHLHPLRLSPPYTFWFFFWFF